MDAGVRAWDHISTEGPPSTLASAPPVSRAVCDVCVMTNSGQLQICINCVVTYVSIISFCGSAINKYTVCRESIYTSGDVFTTVRTLKLVKTITLPNSKKYKYIHKNDMLKL
jgi:hypothetical protein